MKILESNTETGEFDADVYIDALRNELDDSSPDVTRMKLRSSYKDRHHPHMFRRAPKEKDEEYIRYREVEKQREYAQWAEKPYRQKSNFKNKI
jgi:peptide methionine sulfoxide reductase MsrB